MIPYLMTIFSTVLNLARVCPKCGHRQVVPASEKHKPVRCTKCRSELPPKRRS